MRLPAIRVLAAFALPWALAACSDDDTAAAGASAPPPVTGEAATLTGSVVKGVTANAVITITAPDGTLLATTESNGQGAYSVTLPAGYEGAVQVVATAKDHTAVDIPPEERTQMRCDAPAGCLDANNNTVPFESWFEVPLDFRLSAVMSVNGWGIHLANVTPLSTLAAEWAVTFPQGLDATSATEANRTVAAMFGLALSDLEDDLSDIADPLWLQLASPNQVQLALLCATFAEIQRQMGMPMQQGVEFVAASFVSNSGALLEASDQPEPTVAILMSFAEQILSSATIAGVIDMPSDTYNGVQVAMDDLQADLQTGQLSDIKPVSYDYLIAKLGPMGAQLDEVMTITNLKNPQEFIDAQSPYFSWMVSEDNVKMAPVVAQAIVSVALSSLWVDIAPATLTDLEMPGSVDGEYLISLNVPTRRLTMVGTTNGQTVDLTIDVTSILAALENGKRFNFAVSGTVSNATSTAAIDTTIVVDAKNVDFTALVNQINTFRNATDGYTKLLALIQLPAVASQYAYTLNAEIWGNGTASLTRNDDTSQKVAASFDVLAFVDLAATGSQKLVSIDLKSADLVLPSIPGQTNHLYADNGKHILKLDMAQDLSVTVDGAGTMFGLPETVLHATGELAGARLLFDHVRDTLVDGFVGAFQDSMQGSSTTDFATLVDTLFDFDFSQLSATGDALLKIADLGHEYRAHLEDTLLTVYQPFSEEVALTAELRMNQDKVHFELGADKEPWDLRALTTPTPRLALIGPNGEYAEMTQEDFYAFLDTLNVRQFLDSFLTELFPPAAT